MKKILVSAGIILFIVVSAWGRDVVSLDAGMVFGATVESRTDTYYDFVQDKQIVEEGRNEGDIVDFLLGLDYFHLHNDSIFGYGLKTGVTLGDFKYETMDYDISYTSASVYAAPQLEFEFCGAKVIHRLYVCPLNLRYGILEEGQSEHFLDEEKIPSGTLFSAGTVLGYCWQHGNGSFKKGFVAGLETNWYNLIKFDGEKKGSSGDGFCLWAAFRMSYNFK